MVTRLSAADSLRMPPVGHNLVDTQAVALFDAWLTQDLPGYLSFADWQIYYFGSTNAPGAAPTADPEHDGSPNYLKYLLGENPLVISPGWTVSAQAASGVLQLAILQPADRGTEVQFTTNLFDPFSWQFLDVVANRPFFPANPRVEVVPDPLTSSTAKFYRVRLFSP
jgi:hypothetical protein